MSYGFPYRGSKNGIADDLISMMPSSDVFVDMFGGGGAMTHRAILSHRYKRFIYNDLSKSVYRIMKNLKKF